MTSEEKASKWMGGDMNAEEEQQFLSDPQNDVYKKIAELSSRFRTPEFDEQSMYKKIHTPIKTTKKVRLNTYWMAAATVALLIAGAFAYRDYTYRDVYAEAGRTATHLLPDDSEVTLNAISSLRYNQRSWDNERSVRLEGEAYFKVRKGSTFVVETTSGSVTVVGTQFNVRDRDGRLEVSCYEGAVRVRTTKIDTVIHKNAMLVIADGKLSEARTIGADSPAWQRREIQIVSETLPAILAELGRSYNINIEITELGAGQKFTGTLPANNLDVALQTICVTYGIETGLDENGVRIFYKK